MSRIPKLERTFSNTLNVSTRRSSPLEDILNKTRSLWTNDISDDKHRAFGETYFDDPVGFVQECFLWDKAQDEGPTRYQMEIMEALVDNKRVCVRGPRGLGKCVGAEDTILLSDGRYVRAGDLIGRHFGVLALHKNGDVKPALAMASDNGIKPVYKVTTRYGRELYRTANHPLLKFDGWTRVDELKAGDLIAMPTRLPIEGSRPLPDGDVKILAYLIGDGSLTSHVVFVNGDDKLIQEMRDAVAEYGCELLQANDDAYAWRVSLATNIGKPIWEADGNPVRSMLKKYGIGKDNAFAKHVPDALFECPNRQIALFLSRLLACDGWAHSADGRGGNQIGYSSVSKELVLGVQRLFLRLGIIGKVRRRTTRLTTDGITKEFPSYVWEIHDAENLLRFGEIVGIYSKEEAVEAAMRVARERTNSNTGSQFYARWPNEALLHLKREAKKAGMPVKELLGTMGVASRGDAGKPVTSKIALGNSLIRDERIDMLLKAEVGWDEIASIEYVGEMPTVAITVPGPATYVCDLFEHNTGLSSWIIWWFALTRDALELDWKIATTASNNRQLVVYLWPEIHKWGRRINWLKVGREAPNPKDELTTRMLRLNTGQAYAVASDSGAATEGAHADHMLYMFDESKVIPDVMWDSAEGALVKKNAMAVAVSTPGIPSGRFYEIQSKKEEFRNWWVRRVTLQEAIDAGRIDAQWVEDRRLQWGENSALFQNHVIGDFAQDEDDVLIPLWWIEKATDRWYERQHSRDHDLTVIDQLGLDVARMGADKTVLARRSGMTILPLEKYSKQDLMKTAGLVVPYLNHNPELMVNIDIVGLGAGTYDRVTEQFPDNENIMPFHPQSKTDFRDASELWEFQDVYSAAWWYARECLDPNNPRKLPELLALPPDDDLPAELSSPTWNITSNGKIQVERKEKVRERVGRSPDAADSVIMAVWNDGIVGMEFG